MGTMADKDKALARLTEFGVTIHEVLRYGYGGLLAYLVAALVAPSSTKTVVESLGTTIRISPETLCWLRKHLVF